MDAKSAATRRHGRAQCLKIETARPTDETARIDRRPTAERTQCFPLMSAPLPIVPDFSLQDCAAADERIGLLFSFPP